MARVQRKKFRSGPSMRIHSWPNGHRVAEAWGSDPKACLEEFHGRYLADRGFKIESINGNIMILVHNKHKYEFRAYANVEKKS